MAVTLEEIREQPLYSSNVVQTHEAITARFVGAVRRYLPTWIPGSVDDALYKVIQAIAYVWYVFEVKNARAIDSTTLRGANLDDLKTQAINRGVEVNPSDTDDQVRFELANKPLSYSTGSIPTIQAQAREVSGVIDAVAIRRVPLTAIDVYILSEDAVASNTLILQTDIHMNQHEKQLAGLDFIIHPANVVSVNVHIEIIYYPDVTSAALVAQDVPTAIDAMLRSKRQRFVESSISDADIIAAGKSVPGVFDINVISPAQNLVAPNEWTVYDARVMAVGTEPFRRD